MQSRCKSGFLVINKPLCERSTHCVEIVRHILGKKTKVGHGGTLDSTASGVLIVLVGAATRLSNIVIGLPKCYKTTVKFGAETDTDDDAGEITRTADTKQITLQNIDKCLSEFSGWRLQAPPSVSAVHVNGKRAHEIARAGEQISIAPKAVYFEKVERLGELTADFEVSFRISCQKGTYIRSFGRDLGRTLHSAAHIVKLEREYVGAFQICNAIDFCDIEKMSAEDIYTNLTPLDILKSSMPCYVADSRSERKILQGQSVLLSSVSKIESASMRNCFMNRAIVLNDNIFSICNYFVDGDGEVFLQPSVNIFAVGD